MLMGMPPENCAMVGRCGPSLVIESDGSVYPCDFYALDAWKLGSISDDSPGECSQVSGNRPSSRISARSSACRACRWYSLCRNGCKRERVPETGLTRWCGVHTAFFEYAYPRMREMAKALQNRLSLQSACFAGSI